MKNETTNKEEGTRSLVPRGDYKDIDQPSEATLDKMSTFATSCSNRLFKTITIYGTSTNEISIPYDLKVEADRRDNLIANGFKESDDTR